MGDLPDIKFNYTCDFPFEEVEVFASGNGSGIIIVNCLTDDEVELSDLSFGDQIEIKCQVNDWASHYAVMSKSDAFHPDDNAGYARSLNQEMGK